MHGWQNTGRVSAAPGDAPATEDGVGGVTEGLGSFKGTNTALCASEGKAI